MLGPSRRLGAACGPLRGHGSSIRTRRTSACAAGFRGAVSALLPVACFEPVCIPPSCQNPCVPSRPPTQQIIHFHVARVVRQRRLAPERPRSSRRAHCSAKPALVDWPFPASSRKEHAVPHSIAQDSRLTSHRPDHRDRKAACPYSPVLNVRMREQLLRESTLTLDLCLSTWPGPHAVLAFAAPTSRIRFISDSCAQNLGAISREL